MGPARDVENTRLSLFFFFSQNSFLVLFARSPGEEDWRHSTPNNTVMIRGLPQNITEQHVSYWGANTDILITGIATCIIGAVIVSTTS